MQGFVVDVNSGGWQKLQLRVIVGLTHYDNEIVS